MARPFTFDWESLDREAIELLRTLVRIDTTNPPGNEIAVVRVVEPLLREAGLDPQVVEPEPGRASLVARWKGNGSARPVLLHGHTDVVPADPSRWRRDPFGAEIADGCIWGRGTIDMKQTVAMQVATVLALARARVELERDLILALWADEETGSALGSRWVAEHHSEWIDAEYALGEAGAYTLHIGGKPFYPIMVAEKGYVWLRLVSEADPGHGSMPTRDSAVLHLAEAVRRLGRSPLRFQVTPVMQRFVEGVAEEIGGVRGAVLRRVLHPIGLRLLGNVVFPDTRTAEAFSALVHDTAAPTGLEAGGKINQIPGRAVALVDCRTLPGQTTEGLVELVRRVAGKQVSVEVVADGPPVEMEGRDPMLDHLLRAADAIEPEGKAVPNLITGFTDAKPLAALGIRTYGFSPVVLPPDLRFAAMYHGVDERIPVEGFRRGLHVFAQTVLDFCRPA